MIKVNGIEVTKGCTVKFRAGGEAIVRDWAANAGNSDTTELYLDGYTDDEFILFYNSGKFFDDEKFPLDIIEVIPPATTFKRGDRVRKKGNKGQWQGHIVGEYSTECTPEGYAVESERELNSVQIYPASALEYVEDIT